ncbi:MAG: protein kinase [Proteobacteria bacterium]|nr:protein kinase [Pseudomonadota bacterium]
MATCPECRTVYSDDQKNCESDGTELLPDAAFTAADRELARDDKVGEYHIVSKLGEGAFGTVYKAVQPLIGKEVAIKVLKRQFASNPEIVSRFIAEARAVNQIQHRHIVDIFSFGTLDDGRQYYVMSYLAGQTLKDLLANRGRLPVAVALPILRAVAEAVDAAHKSGIAHRDLKPENVFVTKDGDVKLLDFGVAKLMTGDSQHKTRTGAMIGTPQYMAPEQCSGREVDHRADIYAFGVMTFQLLTGRVPFTGRDIMDLLFKHYSQEPPSPSQTYSELPGSFDEPILHMLKKQAADRPATLSEAIEAVASAAERANIEVPRPTSRVAVTLPAAPPTPDRALELEPTLASDSAMPQASASTIMGAESHAAARPGKRRKSAVAIAAGVLAVAAVVAFGFFGIGDQTDTIPAEAPPSTVTAPAAIETSNPVKPSAPTIGQRPTPAALGKATKTDVAPATVEIEIQGTPDGTTVIGPDGKKIGVAPGIIELERGDQTITLSFRKPGYRSARTTLTPSADRIVSIAMKKRAARKSTSDKKAAVKKPAVKEPSPDDIEEAF